MTPRGLVFHRKGAREYNKGGEDMLFSLVIIDVMLLLLSFASDPPPSSFLLGPSTTTSAPLPCPYSPRPPPVFSESKSVHITACP